VTATRILAPAIALLLLATPAAYPAAFTLEQVLSAPFASDIVAAPAGRAFAWVSDVRGRRNLWLALARAPNGAFAPHSLTHYSSDDGLEISDIAFLPRHEELLYVLGGDIEYPDKPAPDPAQLASGVEQQIYLVDFRGHAPIKLGDGHAPLASPDGERVLFLHGGKVFALAPHKGAKAEELFKTRGVIDSLRFSPDGRQLAFVCTRGDHSFIGVYSFTERSLRWIDASFSFDLEPRWSPDGTRLAFVSDRDGKAQLYIRWMDSGQIAKLTAATVVAIRVR